MAVTFADFQSNVQSLGFSEVLERQWGAGTTLDTHVHPFDANALMVEGEMWLTVGDTTRHLVPGDTFELTRNTPHAERYGSEGARFWVGRRA
jgi:hypothetical protein